MRASAIWICAILVLLSACETPDDEAAGAAGAGGAGGGVGSAAVGGVSGADLSGGGGTPAQQLQRVGDRIYFDFDKYTLSPEARVTIEQQAAVLVRSPSVAVSIEGHCDERGTREYNLALGERRANSVKDYLITLGVAADRISTISFGEERPDVIGSSDAAWAKNRRAVTVVAGGRVGG
jgi:peptidoglycan-associated lipoprotein